MTDPQDVTAGGAPIVRTDVRPQAEHSPPPAVTQPVGGDETAEGKANVSTPPSAFRCKWLPDCAVYQAIKVSTPNHGACRVTFHGDLVGVWTWTDAAMIVHGLHAGAHMEASKWRWTEREEV